jgi:hypothetical protein
MGAELLAPLAKWGSLVLLVLALVGLAVHWLRSGAKARTERDALAKAHDRQRDALEAESEAAERGRRRWL